MSAPLVDVLARVLDEHQMSLRINSVTGVSYCECGEALSCVDPLDEEVRGATHRAHVAAEQARAVGEWLTSDETVEAIYSTTRAETARGLYAAVGDVLAALRGYGLGETE